MNKTTFNAFNVNKPAPAWFRKLKNVLTILFDASIVIALICGYTENSKEVLIGRVTFSAIMNSLNQLLANGQNYTDNEDNN